MARIRIVDPLDAEGVELLRVAGHRVDPPPDDAEVEAIVVRSTTRVDRAALDRWPSLRLVGVAGVGLDHLDLGALEERAVRVVHAPNANVVSAADHTLALLLAVARRVCEADASLKAGRWERERLRGFELEGKTLGIVGFGRVGSRVAARALGFGMRVIACDPYVDPYVLQAGGAEPVPFDAVWVDSDVVTLHVPLTDETRHLVGRPQLAALALGQRARVLINAARGAVVDSAAVLAALEEGTLAGAGLDVFEDEPLVDYRLAAHPRVVATPHLGSRTHEAQARVARELANNMIAALAES